MTKKFYIWEKSYWVFCDLGLLDNITLNSLDHSENVITEVIITYFLKCVFELTNHIFQTFIDLLHIHVLKSIFFQEGNQFLANYR